MSEFDQRLLICSQLVGIWVLGTYLLPGLGQPETEPPRGLKALLRPLLVGAAPWLVVQPWLPAVGFGVVAAGATFALPMLRRWLRTYGRVAAGAELLLVAIVFAASWLAAAPSQLRPPLFTVPVDARQLSALALASAVVVFVVFGGRFLIDAVLASLAFAPQLSPAERLARIEAQGGHIGAVPPPETEDQRTWRLQELYRARVIGYFERLLVLVTAALLQFDALGFLIAAKGLARSEKISQPGGSAYFLIGTLASVSLAVAGGLALHALYVGLWSG